MVISVQPIRWGQPGGFYGLLVDVCIDLRLQKTQWANTRRWHDTKPNQTITDWENFSCGLGTSPLFFSGSLMSKCHFIWRKDFIINRLLPFLLSISDISEAVSRSGVAWHEERDICSPWPLYVWLLTPWLHHLSPPFVSWKNSSAGLGWHWNIEVFVC